jgi:hypothetical protein
LTTRGEASAVESVSFLRSRTTPICDWGLDVVAGDNSVWSWPK